jgi:hypothetical protein
MKNIKVIFCTLLISSFTFTVRAQSEAENNDVSLSKYKTYSWLEDTLVKRPDYNPRSSGKKVFHLDIKEEVNNELRSRGYVMVSEKPDFLVSTKATLEKSDNSNSTDWARSAGKGLASPNGATIGSTGIDMSPDAGNTTKVKVVLIDPTTKATIWTGNKSKVVGEIMTLTGSLETDVSDIFKKFPVRKRKFIK